MIYFVGFISGSVYSQKLHKYITLQNMPEMRFLVSLKKFSCNTQILEYYLLNYFKENYSNWNLSWTSNKNLILWGAQDFSEEDTVKHCSWRKVIQIYHTAKFLCFLILLGKLSVKFNAYLNFLLERHGRKRRELWKENCSYFDTT